MYTCRYFRTFKFHISQAVQIFAIYGSTFCENMNFTCIHVLLTIKVEYFYQNVYTCSSVTGSKKNKLEKMVHVVFELVHTLDTACLADTERNQ